MALKEDLFENIVHSSSAKKFWDALVTLYEGTQEIREKNPSLLTHVQSSKR